MYTTTQYESTLMMESVMNNDVEKMNDKDNVYECIQEEPIYLTMSAKSSLIVNTKMVKTLNDCETVNYKQSCEKNKSDMKTRTPWNKNYVIFFVGIICILPIFSLIGLLIMFH